MKKIIFIIFICTIILVNIKEKQFSIIPESAIRFRVIANSNSENDQSLKLSVKNDVEKELYKLLGGVKTINEARKVIENNISKVESILDKYNIDYEINYGNNYFPEKEYKGIKYEKGLYESLVIKIGEGLGKNWWCVLFPPLCLLDSSENLENNKYELYAKKLINKYY